ncbi:MAG TPA: alpha-amylase family glycosyl hydrolase, partial [Cellvibrio sp.]|nr:alpha-amylase family glycosyl hydrolase [Cellvibrio sp.]
MDTLAPRHGARLEKQGTSSSQEAITRFSLWAPDASAVAVKLDNGQLHDLQPLADGWYSRLVPCSAGTGYKFLINGRLEVPDPASRAQVDDVLGMSCVVDHDAYAWQTADWRGRPWHEAIIYELHVGLLGGFAETEVILPHLVELGVTAIELMPLNEFPGARNWGYDGAEIFAPESSYGTPDELKHLIDTAHSLG